MLYKHLFLDKDRKQPEIGKLMNEEEMYRFKMLHICFQSLRIPIDFNQIPYSIFVFKIYKYSEGDLEEDYDYIDSKIPVIAIRMNGIGIIVSFGDGGTQKKYLKDELKKYENKELHPIQFNEIYSYILYTRLLIQSPSEYIVADSDDRIQIGIFGISSNKGLSQFNYTIYARFLYHAWRRWGFTQDMIFYDCSQKITRTYLLNENDELQIIPKNCRFIKFD